MTSATDSIRALYITEFWPNAQLSAAGRRHEQIVRILQNMGCLVCCASTAQNTHETHTKDNSYQTLALTLNTQESEASIVSYNPNLVVFDRFLQEEKWGWIFDTHLPSCIKITDTSDFYSLRSSREKALLLNRPWVIEDLIQDSHLYRELSSLYKSDLSLIISEFEWTVLQKILDFKTPSLLHVPFQVTASEILTPVHRPHWNQRKHLVFVGQYRHRPNVDCINYIQSELWPELISLLPDLELHIYGAGFPSEFVHRYNARYKSLQIKGPIKDLHNTLARYRLLFAPLRFGAGQKGKFIDAFCTYTPVVTSSLGAEGMWNLEELSNSIADSSHELIQRVLSLYSNSHNWDCTQDQIHALLQRFQSSQYEDTLKHHLLNLMQSPQKRSGAQIIGALLKQNAYQAQRYKYKYIQEKTKK